jgi:ATPase family AAA domain-containing protein 3A/B
MAKRRAEYQVQLEL